MRRARVEERAREWTYGGVGRARSMRHHAVGEDHELGAAEPKAAHGADPGGGAKEMAKLWCDLKPASTYW